VRAGRVLAAACATFVIGGVLLSHPDTRTACAPYTYVEGMTDQAKWDRLMSEGWGGRTGDQREAIYPPGCWEPVR
jgi:hypothetical protein